MNMPLWMSLEKIQPSQLYISTAKLATILSEIEKRGIGHLPPIPVKQLDNNIIATDGHTRLFALYLMGERKAPIEWENENLDWEAYRICVNWCKNEDICSAKDFVGRLVTGKEYQEVWLDRCRMMQEDLERQRTEKR